MEDYKVEDYVRFKRLILTISESDTEASHGLLDDVLIASINQMLTRPKTPEELQALAEIANLDIDKWFA